MSTSQAMPASGSGKRSIIGSLLSAFAGWTALMIVVISSNVIGYFWISPELRSADYLVRPGFFTVFGAVAGLFIFGTWLVLLLPLYLLIPLNSILWRWPWCAACGMIGGATIMFLLIHFTSPQAGWQIYTILAGMVGGVTTLFASLTRHRFRT